VFPEKLTVSPMICVQLWPLPETPVPLKLTPSPGATIAPPKEVVEVPFMVSVSDVVLSSEYTTTPEEEPLVDPFSTLFAGATASRPLDLHS